MTDPFDDFLRRSLQDDGEPPDTGFTQRVVAALPVQSTPHQGRWIEWAQRAHWVAMSVASCGVAALLSGNGAAPDLPRLLAAGSLLCLLSLWSVPSRWSRG